MFAVLKDWCATDIFYSMSIGLLRAMHYARNMHSFVTIGVVVYLEQHRVAALGL